MAQSLGEVARQERERREKLKKHATRVFTNEDLAKPQILDPLDRVRLSAATVQAEPLAPELEIGLTVIPPASGESVGVGLPTNLSLGDVARYYRLKKLLGEDALARRLRPADASSAIQPQATQLPTLDAAPMSPAMPAPAVSGVAELSPAGPGTPPGVVLGDVARTYRQQSPARASTAVLAGAAPDVTPAQLPTTYTNGPIGGISATPTQTLPPLTTRAGRPVAPVIPERPGAVPDVSLGDVARELQQRQQEPTPWLSPSEGVAPVATTELSSARVRGGGQVHVAPALPSAAGQLAPAEFAEPRVAPALKVFTPALPATRPASRPRLLQVIKLSEQDVVSAVTLVVVERGDSLWRIAARHLGDGRRWKELHTQNPEIRNPHHIRVGDVIRVPHQQLAERRREFSTLHVRPGDTLWGLAALEFGRGTAWACIARANPQLHDPDVLFPGQELILPESCSEAL